MCRPPWDIFNDLKDRAANGEQVFFDIYSGEKKAADAEKEDTGFFFSFPLPSLVRAGG